MGLNITRDDCARALRELRHGRSRSRWRVYCRSLLWIHGGGARTLSDVPNDLLESLFAAAGGNI
jgi:hypothetical protein